MTVNAVNNPVLAWTSASDVSAGVNPVNSDRTGNTRTSSTRLAAQSNSSIAVRDTRQPRTHGQCLRDLSG